MSFRFLNPRMVDEDPEFLDDVCYKSIGDEPEILCNEIPPNQLRFLGWWYLTPERHFLEWIGFVLMGTILVSLLRHKMIPPRSLPPHKNTSKVSKQALTPRLWMKLCTLFFYPYVAYTKLSWKGSYYPGRWLLFVGMPVGTLWLCSVFFCCSSVLWSGYGNNNTLRVVYRIRYWCLEIWLSFLPLIKDMLPGLFVDAIYSIKQYLHHNKMSSGHDGENANVAYFCHCLYLVLVPSYYYLWTGELSDQLSSATTENTRNKMNISNLQRIATESVTKQTIGTAICVIYYMGIVTPASIVAGLNVNFLLQGIYGEGKNFRIYLVVWWFVQGCVFRWFLGVAKLLMKEASRTTRAALRDFVGDEENQSSNYKDR